MGTVGEEEAGMREENVRRLKGRGSRSRALVQEKWSKDLLGHVRVVTSKEHEMKRGT